MMTEQPKNKVVKYCINNNKPLDWASLPSSLTYLKICNNFNQPLELSSFKLLTHLEFCRGSEFDQPLNALPETLTHLIFNGKFNQPLNALPGTLTHLIFRKYSHFKKPLDALPQSVIYLEFGFESEFHARCLFNKPLDALPQSLTHLTFSWNSEVNQQPDVLPIPLTYLVCGYESKQSLKINYVYHNLDPHDISWDGVNVKKIEIHHFINHIPLTTSIDSLMPSNEIFKQVKAIQHHFKTNVTHELVPAALHPRRIGYLLSLSNDSLFKTLGNLF